MRNRRWLNHAAAKIQSYFVRERLLEHESAIEAYQKGGMVKAEIDGILAAEFCQALLAPVVEAYQDERDEDIRIGSEAVRSRRSQLSVVRKIDHKLTVCGTADDCLNCDFCDLWDREWNSLLQTEDREWNLLLQKKKGSRVELAPTEEVDGERAGGAYYFVSISEILR